MEGYCTGSEIASLTRTCTRWLWRAQLSQKYGRQVEHIRLNSCHLFLQGLWDWAVPSLLCLLMLQGEVTPEQLHTTSSVGRTCLFAGQAAEAVLIPSSFWEMKVLDSSMNDTGKDPITVKLSTSQPPLPLPLFISLRSLNCNLVIILYRAWADMKHLETVVVTLWDTCPRGTELHRSGMKYSFTSRSLQLIASSIASYWERTHQDDQLWNELEALNTIPSEMKTSTQRPPQKVHYTSFFLAASVRKSEP